MPKQLCQRCSAKKLDEVAPKWRLCRRGRLKMLTSWNHWLTARLRKIRARLPYIQQHHALGTTKKARFWSKDLRPKIFDLVYLYICIHTYVITHAPDLEGFPISSDQSVIFGRTVCSRYLAYMRWSRNFHETLSHRASDPGKKPIYLWL